MASSVQADPTWPELLGSDNWSGLLDPLHMSLRELILRCGDLCQATYDAFNDDLNSKYCGASRYGKASLFRKVMLENAADYQITSFVYATALVSLPEAFLMRSQSRESWDRESNWFGYIAVTSDHRTRSIGRREIYVALRGTTRNYEWIDVLGAELESANPLLRSGSSDGPKVMKGWLSIYTSDDPTSEFTKSSMRSQIRTQIDKLREQYKGEKLSVTFTGHSLGASLSLLGAFDLAENAVTDIPVSGIVFGCPQVGNRAFNERLKKFPNLHILHVKNTIDLIPHYPSHIMGYTDSGTELAIDTRKSPSLKDSKHPSDWHNLQGMLHMIAGWNGEEAEFELRVKRSVALVNKSTHFLKDDLLIPRSWWVEKNKGMLRNQHGDWVLAPPDDEDIPVPEI